MAHRKGTRTRKQKHGVSRIEIAAILIVLVVVGWAVYSFLQTPSSTTSGSASAGDFTLPVVGPHGLTGEKITLSQFRGKVVLLEMMEPWCPHCQNMAPVLESLYQHYSSQNVVFIAVSGPWQGTTADDTAGFILDYSSSYTYVYDSSGNVFNTFGVTGTPTFFIVAKNGSIVSTYSGEVTYQTLAADLTRFNS